MVQIQSSESHYFVLSSLKQTSYNMTVVCTSCVLFFSTQSAKHEG